MTFSGRIYINRLSSYRVSFYGILPIRRITQNNQSINQFPCYKVLDELCDFI